MNTFTLTEFQRSTGLVAVNAASVLLQGGQSAVAFYQWLNPHLVHFGWETLDSAMAEGRSKTIAASIWTAELGMRFDDWCEDPQNKERVNRAAQEISIYSQRAFRLLCWTISATRKAEYRSRPYVKKAIALGREVTIQAMVLIRFLWGLHEWLERLDYEEIEKCQLALPCSPPLALLAPAPEPQANGDAPWEGQTRGKSMVSAPVTANSTPLAETLLLLAPAAPEPAPKTAKAGGRKNRAKSGGNRKKPANGGTNTAKGNLKSKAKVKVVN